MGHELNDNELVSTRGAVKRFCMRAKSCVCWPNNPEIVESRIGSCQMCRGALESR